MGDTGERRKHLPGVPDVSEDGGRKGFTGDAACVAEFHNVTYTQNTKKESNYILKNFSLKLYPGKIAAVASLRCIDFEPVINLIFRSYEHPEYMLEKGSVLVNGENTSLLNRNKAQPYLKAFNIIAPAFGAGVKRSVVSDGMTVFEYVSQKHFLDYYEMDELSKCLKIIGFYDIDALYESKYNSLTLSDKQRLKIAQNLAFPQDIAVIVYPTMSLNGESKYFLQRLMTERLDSGTVKTFLLLSEDIEFIGDTADYIVVLEHGQVIISGTKDEVKNNSDNEFIQSMLVKI